MYCGPIVPSSLFSSFCSPLCPPPPSSTSLPLWPSLHYCLCLCVMYICVCFLLNPSPLTCIHASFLNGDCLHSLYEVHLRVQAMDINNTWPEAPSSCVRWAQAQKTDFTWAPAGQQVSEAAIPYSAPSQTHHGEKQLRLPEEERRRGPDSQAQRRGPDSQARVLLESVGVETAALVPSQLNISKYCRWFHSLWLWPGFRLSKTSESKCVSDLNSETRTTLNSHLGWIEKLLTSWSHAKKSKFNYSGTINPRPTAFVLGLMARPQVLSSHSKAQYHTLLGGMTCTLPRIPHLDTLTYSDIIFSSKPAPFHTDSHWSYWK